MPLFGNGDRCLRWTEGLAPAQFDLNEDEGITLPGDKIDFSVRGSVVAGKDLVAVFFKRVRSQRFSGLAKKTVLPGHRLPAPFSDASKGPPVQGARTPKADGFKMLWGGVSLVAGKIVLWIKLMVGLHLLIPVNLGEHRGSGD